MVSKETNPFRKPIKAGPLSHRVMDEIRKAMLNGDLKPGDRLPTETELSESLGVGKSSVREAVKMLEVLGVLDTRQGDGTYLASRQKEQHVNPLVYQLILLQGGEDSIFELRAMFEPAYSLLALHNATEADIRKLEQAHADFREKVSHGTQQADDDLAFHRAMLEATHNPYVVRIGETILQLFSATIARSMKHIPERAVQDHEAILQAFLKKDATTMQHAIHESFAGWRSMMADPPQPPNPNGS